MFDVSFLNLLSVGLGGILVGSFLLVILFFVTITRGKRLSDVENLLRFSSIILVASLALCANNSWVYFAAIFIIATGITKLEFLLNLAAIIRGGEGATKYFETMMKVPYANIELRTEQEEIKTIKIRETTKKGKINLLELIEIGKIRPLLLGELALRELERKYNSIIKRQVRIGRFVADGVMMIDSKTDAIVEIKFTIDAAKRIIPKLIQVAKEYKQQYNRNVVVILALVNVQDEYLKEIKEIAKMYEKENGVPIWIEPVEINII